MKLKIIEYCVFMNVKISVIIPVFNCENYLDTCLTSVLMQNFQNYEIICVDDKSTDNSLNILKKYAKKDNRIKILINNQNKGPGYSRNSALDIAKGKYIFFLDGDDWIDKKTFELLYHRCEKDALDLIMYKYITYNEDSNIFDYEGYYDMDFMNKYDKKVFNHLDLKPDEVFNLPVGPCNKLYNKSFLDKNNIKFPNENLIQEDNSFFYKVITLANKVSLLNMYLYNRRRRLNSIMGSLNDDRLFGRIYIAELLLCYFLTDEKLYNHYKKELFKKISTHFTDESYTLIKEEFKDEMYDAIHNLYIKFFYTYNLKEDVIKNVDEEFLIKFGLIE